MMMERRIDDVRSTEGLEWEVEQASTIAALKVDVLELHRKLAAETLRADQGWQRYEGANATAQASAAQVAALASQPAAPVQPDALTTAQALHLRNLTLDYAALAFQGTTLLDGDAVVATIRNMKSLPIDISVLGNAPAAPPVQQPDDAREVPGIGHPTTHADLARISPLALWNRWYPQDRSVTAKEAFIAARNIPFVGQALATTRPGAALTDLGVAMLAFKHCSGMVKGDQWAFSPDQMKVMARAILAASGGSEQVVPSSLAPTVAAPNSLFCRSPTCLFHADMGREYCCNCEPYAAPTVAGSVDSVINNDYLDSILNRMDEARRSDDMGKRARAAFEELCAFIDDRVASAHPAPSSPTAPGQQAQAVPEGVMDKVRLIADELEQSAMTYGGDFADTVKGCAEVLHALTAQASANTPEGK